MLTQICKEINNWFTYEQDKHRGLISIVDGKINPPLVIENGRYYRIIGSRFNDGVFRYDDSPTAISPLKDEAEFAGAIWLMSCPQDFIDLCVKIKEWDTKNGAVDSQNMSPFTSESFDIYSYSKGSKSGGSGANGASVTWQDQFAKQLNRYRKVGIR